MCTCNHLFLNMIDRIKQLADLLVFRVWEFHLEESQGSQYNQRESHLAGPLVKFPQGYLKLLKGRDPIAIYEY